MKMQFNLLQTQNHEFISLRRASKGEKNISILEVKKDMIKAIEVLQSKLEMNDKLVDLLSNTRLALMENANK
jgi:hypothetical protein